SSSIGTSRSLWPRPITSSRAPTRAPAASNRAAVQAAVEVSMARITTCPQLTGRECVHRTRQAASRENEGLDRLDRFHLGNVVADEVLDPAPQGDGRRGGATASDRAPQVE